MANNGKGQVIVLEGSRKLKAFRGVRKKFQFLAPASQPRKAIRTAYRGLHEANSRPLCHRRRPGPKVLTSLNWFDPSRDSPSLPFNIFTLPPPATQIHSFTSIPRTDIKTPFRGHFQILPHNPPFRRPSRPGISRTSSLRGLTRVILTTHRSS